MPSLLIIAGPNGAGKTTFAREYLPKDAGCLHFINADLIAEGLSPFAPAQAAVHAGRLMLEEIRRLVAAREDFAFETTLSGRIWARAIPEWRTLGYRVEIIFLRLPDADMAVRRVASRVLQGGHDVPEATIRRRFASGLRNFQDLYALLADAWSLYDNAISPPQLLAEGGKDV